MQGPQLLSSIVRVECGFDVRKLSVTAVADVSGGAADLIRTEHEGQQADQIRCGAEGANSNNQLCSSSVQARSAAAVRVQRADWTNRNHLLVCCNARPLHSPRAGPVLASLVPLTNALLAVESTMLHR